MFQRLLSFCLLIVILSRAGDAQTNDGPDQRPDLWTKVQDSVWIWLPQADGDTLDRNLVSGSYEFTMQYDSTCLTWYQFTEPWHNGGLLKLQHWNLGRSVNLDEDLLSLNSRTEDFLLHTGDTISFMRYFRWFDAHTGQQDPNNFFSRDTLTYVVELAAAHDSGYHQTRLAVIDSFRVMPRTAPGEPRFIGIGDRAVMSIRRYIVPVSLNNARAFLRIRVRARGNGEYFFTRTDDITVNMSGLLRIPGILSSIDYLKDDRFWKPAMQTGEEKTSTKAKNIIRIQRRSAGDAQVMIQLQPAPDLGVVGISIHDAQGNLLSTPFNGVLDDAKSLRYTFTTSGSYFINLTRGTEILYTEKITITK